MTLPEPDPGGRPWSSNQYSQSLLERVTEEVRVHSVLREVIALAEQASVLTNPQLQAHLIALAGTAHSGCPEHGGPIGPHCSPVERGSRWAAGSRRSRHECRDHAVSAIAWPPGDPWRDVDGLPITRGARVEQATVDAELGALRSRHGTVLRRSAIRLVVRFDGDTRLTRIRPHLLRVVRL